MQRSVDVPLSFSLPFRRNRRQTLLSFDVRAHRAVMTRYHQFKLVVAYRP